MLEFVIMYVVFASLEPAALSRVGLKKVSLNMELAMRPQG